MLFISWNVCDLPLIPYFSKTDTNKHVKEVARLFLLACLLDNDIEYSSGLQDINGFNAKVKCICIIVFFIIKDMQRKGKFY